MAEQDWFTRYSIIYAALSTLPLSATYSYKRELHATRVDDNPHLTSWANSKAVITLTVWPFKNFNKCCVIFNLCYLILLFIIIRNIRRQIVKKYRKVRLHDKILAPLIFTLFKATIFKKNVVSSAANIDVVYQGPTF